MPGHASTTWQGDPSSTPERLTVCRESPGTCAALGLSHTELGHESHGGQQDRGTTRPTFALALVHHFEVGVVSALGRQQVALVAVGVAVRAADLQLAGEAGAVGGAGALRPPVLHLANLVGAAHHSLAALWGQRGSSV